MTENTEICHICERKLTEVPFLLEKHALKLTKDLEYYQSIGNEEKLKDITMDIRCV